MRGLLQSFSLALLLTGGVSHAASADPIQVTFDDRAIAVVAMVNGVLPPRTSEIASDDLFASFDAVVTVAATQRNVMAQSTSTQRSSSSPTRYRALGTAETFETAPDLGRAALTTATSFFGTNFVLPTPYRFVLTDLMTATAVHSHGVANQSEAMVEIFSDATSSFLFTESVSGNGTRQLNHTGFLPAGGYTFIALAAAEGFATTDQFIGEPQSRHRASFDLDFQLMPVPEPGSMLLLGSGLVAFAWQLTRRRSSNDVRSMPRRP